MEVAGNGDLANWTVPGKMIKGMGGAMDLVAGVKRVVVVMNNADKAGNPKIVEKCSLQTTGPSVVHEIVSAYGDRQSVLYGTRVPERVDDGAIILLYNKKKK